MHEWALAEAVISAIMRESERAGLKKVTKVKIRVGELQQIDMDIFEDAVKMLASHEPLLSHFELECEIERTVFRCRACGREWFWSERQQEQSMQEQQQGEHEQKEREKGERKELGANEQEAIHFVPESAHAFLRCPACKSPDFEISKGRGVWVERITGVMSSSS